MHYHRQLTTFWLTKTNRSLLTNYALTATHTSSYNLIQPANRLFRDHAPKKSQALSEAPPQIYGVTQRPERGVEGPRRRLSGPLPLGAFQPPKPALGGSKNSLSSC